MSGAASTEAPAPGSTAPVTAPVETPGVSPHAASPVAPPVPEPTGPGTAAAAQEQLKATERPPTILGEGATAAETPATETPAAEAPAPFDAEKITFPEGTTPDKELLGEFGEIAKAHGLTQPAAQAMVDLYNTVAKKTADANRTAWNSTLKSWEAEVKEDKGVIGKASLKGENGTVVQGLDAVKVMAAKIFDNPALAPPGLRQAIEITGMGSHPDFVRFVAMIGPLLTEGSAVRAGGPSPNVGARDDTAPRTAARALYPNLP